VARELGSRGATLVSSDNGLVFTPFLAEAVGGTVDLRHISVPLRDYCPNAVVVLGSADALDTRRRRVTVQTDWQESVAFEYEQLVVAVGSISQALPVPGLEETAVGAKTVLDGQLALAGNNLIYPALAMLDSGRGVMAFTVVGRDHYPSAGYAGIDAKAGAGDLHIAAEGLGPEDGFSNYKAFGNPPRPRWGDYGAAAVDGNSIWIASEYIGQTCTFAQYLTGAIGSCGGTRTSLGNWGTRISRVTP